MMTIGIREVEFQHDLLCRKTVETDRVIEYLRAKGDSSKRLSDDECHWVLGKIEELIQLDKESE